MTDAPNHELQLEPGEAERPTLKTIARLSGFAVPTVSRALSDAPDIGAKTKETVRKIADQLGYRPNRAGLRLRTGKTNVIALVLSTDHDVMNHTARLINAVAGKLRGTAYHLIVTPYFPDESPLTPVQYITRTGSADGIILNRIEPDDARVAYLRERRFPFALHGRTGVEETAPFFDFDNELYARYAMDAFARRGRKSVLLVSPPLNESYGQHMLKGAQDGAHAHGMKLAIIEGATSDSPSHDITRAVQNHLTQAPETDAIICSSAPSALTSTIAAEEMGRVVGVDFDLAGKEVTPLLNSFRPDILACKEDVALTGAFLAEALIHAIDHPNQPPMQRLLVPEPF